MIRIVEIRGKDVLVNRINRMLEDVSGNNLADVVTRGLEPVAESARLKAPVRTGELRRSIKTRAIRNERNMVEGAVVATAPHAPFVEFGTRKMAAQPFLRPAFLETHRQSLAAITADFQFRLTKNLTGK